jgi:hypothetical protein
VASNDQSNGTPLGSFPLARLHDVTASTLAVMLVSGFLMFHLLTPGAQVPSLDAATTLVLGYFFGRAAQRL